MAEVSKKHFDALSKVVGLIARLCSEARADVATAEDDLNRLFASCDKYRVDCNEMHALSTETRAKLDALQVWLNEVSNKQHEEHLHGLQDELHDLVNKQRLTIRALEDRVRKAESVSMKLVESFKKRDGHFSRMEKKQAAQFERHCACIETLQLRVRQLEDVADWDATNTMDTGHSDMASQRN